MKEIVEYMSHNKVIFKKLKEINPKDIESRKKVKIYLGVNLNGYYCLTIIISKKNHILCKEIIEIINLHKKMEKYNDSKINIKYIIIQAPLSNSAKNMLKENEWKILMKDII
jgi:hypothetical protein